MLLLLVLKKINNFIWVIFDYETKRLFRVDNTTLLLKTKKIYQNKDARSYKLTSFLDNNLSKLDIKLDIVDKNITILNSSNIELNLCWLVHLVTLIQKLNTRTLRLQ